MSLQTALQTVRTLYIEAGPFIYFAESRAGYLDKMRVVFGAVEAARIRVITSVITLTECLNKPLAAGDTGLIRDYTLLCEATTGIRLRDVDSQIAYEAARLRAVHRLRTPDALHLATALSTGCDAFLTNDFALQRVTDLPVLVLDALDLDPTADA